MPVVLLVEDEEQVRVLADALLTDAGFSVLSAAGADGALALLDSEPAIDVLFVDIILGGDLEAGLRLSHVAREKFPQLQVLYTTGQGVNDGMRALFVEPHQFLPKPFTPEQLLKSINFLRKKHDSKQKPPSDTGQT